MNCFNLCFGLSISCQVVGFYSEWTAVFWFATFSFVVSVLFMTRINKVLHKVTSKRKVWKLIHWYCRDSGSMCLLVLLRGNLVSSLIHYAYLTVTLKSFVQFFLFSWSNGEQLVFSLHIPCIKTENSHFLSVYKRTNKRNVSWVFVCVCFFKVQWTMLRIYGKNLK